jgi:hypothetical protein
VIGMTTAHVASSAPLRPLPARPAFHGGRTPYLVSGALAVAATAAAAASLFLPDLLSGAPVTRGNLRGTALVVLFVGVPVLLTAMVRSRGGSARWLVIWVGATAYLAYQGVLFCFATPLNSLFLVYVAQLGLAVWTLLVLSHVTDLAALGARVDGRLPARVLGGLLVTVGLLNGGAWLARIVPTVGSDRPTSVLDGSGLTTSAVWVQDLAFWIPAAVVTGCWLWQHRPRGVLYGGALVVFYAIESLSIASDQWWGAHADASHPALASMGAVPPFVVSALVLALPLFWLLRNLDRHRDLG